MGGIRVLETINDVGVVGCWTVYLGKSDGNMNVVVNGFQEADSV